MIHHGKKILLLFFITPLLLTSCWDQKIFEKTGFILQLGLEVSSEGNFLYTITLPVMGAQKEDEIELITTTSDLMREGREKARLVSGKTVEGGKIQQICFSNELAEKGIHDFMEIFERSSANPLLANIVVIDGSPKEMMEKSLSFDDKPRSAFYANSLLQKAAQSFYAPETRIFNFNITTFAEGIDPVTPMLKLKEQEIEVIGSALFCDDRMVGKIDTRWTPLLLSLMNKKVKTEFLLKENPDSDHTTDKIKTGSAFTIDAVKRKVQIEIQDGTPVIQILLTYEAILDEYTARHDMDNTEFEKTLEDALTDALAHECTELIKYLQEVGSDPVGFGNMVRTKYNTYWKSIDWREKYKEAKFTVAIDLDILRYGAIK